MKKVIKSIFACLLIIALLASIVPATVFAADPTPVKISQIFWGSGATYSKTYNGHSVAISGLNLHMIDGKTAYCMEPWTGSHSGTEYSELNAEKELAKFSTDQQQLIGIILAYGYPNNLDGADTATRNGYAAATQILLWEVILEERTDFNATTTGLYNFMLNNVYFADSLSALKSGYTAILEAGKKHVGDIPSFANGRQDRAPVYTMDRNYETNVCSIDLTDTRGVLANDFPFEAPEGYSIQKNDNTLTITCDYETVKDGSPVFKATGHFVNTDSLAPVFWGNRENIDQIVCTTTYPDPTYAYFKLEAPKAPYIGTTACFENGEKVSLPVGEITVYDDVAYNNLIPGKEYVIKATLMNKSTKEPIVVDGSPLATEVAFIPEEASGVCRVSMIIDASSLSGKSVVFFEELYVDGILVAEHRDINNESQTVTFLDPKIGTTAKFEDGSKEAFKTGEITIVDTVNYCDLDAGKNYVMRGILMNKDDEENPVPVLIDGEKVTNTVPFVPADKDGCIDMEFTFDASKLEAKNVVVFEYLYTENGDSLADHANAADRGQTVIFKEPTLGTSAAFADGSKEVDPISEVELVDTVSYENLIVGKTYVVEGTLMVATKEEGKETEVTELLQDGEPVTATVTFTAEEENGSIDITFTFNASELKGSYIVAFEKLFVASEVEDEIEYTEITNHEDKDDEDQTVTVNNPEFHTNAAVNDSHAYQLQTVKAGEEAPSEIVTLIDTISYKGLTPGVTYTATGSLMIKTVDEAGNVTVEPLMVNGEVYTVSVEFTPETADGEVQVEFRFEAKDLAEKSVVVFEEIYRDADLIGEHKDIDNDDQTVDFHRSVKTGILPDWAWIVLAGGLLAVAVVLVILLKKYKKTH